MQTKEGYYYQDSLGGETDRLPIILIHGAGGTHLNWPATIRRIPGCRVLTVDLPGHGRSEGPACGSVQGYADALLSYLEAASIFRAVLVGYSLGGQIALQFAEDRPDQCAGLGLIACSDDLFLPGPLVELLANDDTYPQAMERIRSLFLFPGYPEKIMARMKNHLFSARQGTMIADIHAMSHFHFSENQSVLKNLPSWICAAREDEICSIGSAHLLASENPGCKISIIRQAGHGLLIEKPLQVQQGLYHFLEISEDSRSYALA